MSNYFTMKLTDEGFVVSCEMSMNDFADFCDKIKKLYGTNVKKGE